MLCDVLHCETHDLKPTAFPNTPNLLRVAQRPCAAPFAARPPPGGAAPAQYGRKCGPRLLVLRSTIGSAALLLLVLRSATGSAAPAFVSAARGPLR